MQERYRVLVEVLDGESEWTEVVTLSATRDQLAGFAPGVVAQALGAAAGQPAPGPVATENAEPSGETAAPAKRTRRTKAQMEQDAAQAVAAVTQPEPMGTPVEATPATEPAPATPAAPYNPFIK